MFITGIKDTEGYSVYVESFRTFYTANLVTLTGYVNGENYSNAYEERGRSWLPFGFAQGGTDV